MCEQLPGQIVVSGASISEVNGRKAHADIANGLLWISGFRQVKNMEIRPISIRNANAYVEQHHRHHGAKNGCRFAIGLYEGGHYTV